MHQLSPLILPIVPARGGSKRLPNKNLMAIGGASLIARTASFLRQEGLLSHAILSTDDDAIAEEGRQVGLSVPFKRPSELAADDSLSIDVVMHALGWFMDENDVSPSYVALLQPTSPFRRKDLLRNALALLEAHRGINSVIGMYSVGQRTDHVFRRDAENSANVRALGGDDALFVPSGSLYVARTTALIEQRTVYAEPIRMSEVSSLEAIDVDTMADLKLAAAVYETGLWPEGQSD